MDNFGRRFVLGVAGLALGWSGRISFVHKSILGGTLFALLLMTGAGVGFDMLSASIRASDAELAAMQQLSQQAAFLREVLDSRAAIVRSAAEYPVRPSNVIERVQALFGAGGAAGEAGRGVGGAASLISRLDPGASREIGFSAYTMLARGVMSRMEADTRSAGLLGDPEVDLAVLMLARHIPSIIDNIAKQQLSGVVGDANLEMYAASVPLLMIDALDGVRQGARQLRGLDTLDSAADARLAGLLADWQQFADGILTTAPAMTENFVVQEIANDAISRHIGRRSMRAHVLRFAASIGAALFILGLGIVVWGSVESIRRSLIELERGSEAFTKGRLDQRIVVETEDEFRLVARNFNQLADDFACLLLTQREQSARSQAELQDLVEQRTLALSSANRRLSATVEMLEKAKDELVQSGKMAALGNLVAGVAHEINTPLGLAYTVVTYLQDCLFEFARKHAAGNMTAGEVDKFLALGGESLASASGNLRRAADLIESFKRIAVDRTSDVRRQFELGGYVREVLASLAAELRKGGHRVEITVEGPIHFDSYPGGLAQVLTNIVLNAVIHGFGMRREGNIRVDCAPAGPGQCRIVVADDGKGIPESAISHVFEPFFTTQRGQGGSGLGLNIVYNIVTRQLGGTIRCESVEGEGAAFILILPLVANPKGEDSLHDNRIA